MTGPYFAAIELPDSAVKALGALRRDVPGVLWPAQWPEFIVLRVFSNLSGADVDTLDNALGAITSPPFDVRLKGVQTRPGASDDRIGVFADGSPGINELAKSCEHVARRLGYPPVTHAPEPSVPLGICQDRTDPAFRAWLSEVGDFTSEQFTVDRFLLCTTQIRATGTNGGYCVRDKVEFEYLLKR